LFLNDPDRGNLASAIIYQGFHPDVGGTKVLTAWTIFLNLGYLQNRIKLLDTSSLLLNIDVRQSQENRTVGQDRLSLATALLI
jgi:hypothetical protein